MAKRQTPIILTSQAANAMISIMSAARDLPEGVPCKVCDSAEVRELEQSGMIERAHVGAPSTMVGVIPTKLGKKFVQDAIRHLSN